MFSADVVLVYIADCCVSLVQGGLGPWAAISSAQSIPSTVLCIATLLIPHVISTPDPSSVMSTIFSSPETFVRFIIRGRLL